MNKPFLQKFYWLGPLFLALISFTVYFSTLNSGVDLGDSGESITCVKILGIPHPPGYPFYIITARIFTLLPFKELAFGVNLFSAVCSSLALGLFGLSLLLVFPSGLGVLAVLISGFSLAFSHTFFSYAGFAKGYALNMLLFSILIFLILKWEKDLPPLWFWLFCLIFGLSISNTYQPNLLALTGFLYFFMRGLYPEEKSGKTFFIFLIPLLLLLVYSLSHTIKLLKFALLLEILTFWLFYLVKGFKKLDKKTVLTGIVLFILGLLPYLYIPLRAQTRPFLNWDEAYTLKGFWDLITIADYRINFSPSLAKVLPQFRLYLNLLVKQFRYPGIILGILGIFYWWKNRRSIGESFILLYLYLVLIFPFQLATPMDELTPYVMEGFYLPAHLIFAFWIAGGVLQLAAWAKKSLKLPRIAIALICACLLWLPGNLLKNNYALCDRHRFSLPTDYAYNLLITVPKNSILLAQSDDGTFPVWYLQQVKGVKADIPVLMADLLSRPWYRRQVSQNFGIQFSDYRSHILQTSQVIKDLIARNYHKDFYLDYPTACYYAARLPQTMTGLLYKIVKPGETADFDLKLNLDLLEKQYRINSAIAPGVPKNFLIKYLTQAYLNNLNETAHRARNAGLHQTAIKLLKTALKIEPNNQIIKHNLQNAQKPTDPYLQGMEYLKSGQSEQAIAIWLSLLQENPDNQNLLNSLGNAYLLAKKYDKSREFYLRALQIYPKAPLVHFNLGRWWEENGNLAEAKNEFRLELKNNPNFLPAQQKIKKLK